jgi:hypothetical protein
MAIRKANDPLADERREQGRTILDQVVEALQADELTTALAPVLHDAQRQAVRLLAPPPDDRKPPATRTPPRPGWKAVETGERDDLTAEDLRGLLAELERKLGAGVNRRLRITWAVLQEETR